MKLHSLDLTVCPFGTFQGRFVLMARLSSNGPDTPIQIDSALQVARNGLRADIPLFLDCARSTKPADLNELVPLILAHTPGLIVRGFWDRVQNWMFPAVTVIHRVNLVDWTGLPFKEIHALFSEPDLEDPVLNYNQANLFLEPTGKATIQDALAFVQRSPNPWRLIVAPRLEIAKSLMPSEE